MHIVYTLFPRKPDGPVHKSNIAIYAMKMYIKNGSDETIISGQGTAGFADVDRVCFFISGGSVTPEQLRQPEDIEISHK